MWGRLATIASPNSLPAERVICRRLGGTLSVELAPERILYLIQEELFLMVSTIKFMWRIVEITALLNLTPAQVGRHSELMLTLLEELPLAPVSDSLVILLVFL